MRSINTLNDKYQQGEKLALLSLYDASFAKLASQAGCDCLLVGDSLAMLVQGHDSTVYCSIKDLAYHISCVRRGAPDILIIGDMSFGSFEQSFEQAYKNAVKLIKAGADLVKLEGKELQVENCEFLTKRGIAVVAHLGLLPQRGALSGYRLVGKADKAAKEILKQAVELDKAGAVMIIAEKIPNNLSAEIQKRISCPLIGIGAGSNCDGQILVAHDILGISSLAKKLSFVRIFLTQPNIKGNVGEAFKAYVGAVKDKSFPNESESF